MLINLLSICSFKDFKYKILYIIYNSKGANVEEYKKLGLMAYKLIKDEHLIVPKKITFRKRGKGTKKQLGSLIHYHKDDTYKIIIQLFKRKYVVDPNGKFYMGKDNSVRYSIGEGAELPYEAIVETLAHEIAHLKHWNHTEAHKIYTKYLEKQLLDMHCLDDLKVESNDKK